MDNKSKVIGIIGFGKEGQALFDYYKDKFDQAYIFDEKLKDISSIVNNLKITEMGNSPLEGEGTASFPCDILSEGLQAKPDRVNHVTKKSRKLIYSNGVALAASTFKPNLQLTNSNNLPIKLFNNFQIPSEVDFLVKSPGIALSKIQLSNPKLKIKSLISILFEKLDMSKVIAVTGTKGKSTVSSLVAHILKSSGYKVELLGNIGNINISLLDSFDREKYYVFELSSFQCQQLTLSPHIAIWTNFFVDHQDVHIDMEEYYEAKRNITKFQTPNDFFITIPELEKVETKATKIVVSNIDNFKTKLLGQHNQINCQLAYEACIKLGLKHEQIREAVSTFEPIKGRLEKVGETTKNGKLIEFYTDDLATIPEATWQAILAFEGRVTTLITGGSIKGSDYTELSNQLAGTNIKNIIYFNPTGKEIVANINPTKINLREAKSMQEAVDLAFQFTDQGVCLLSCASASFGMFKNAYDRGEQFSRCVNKNKLQFNSKVQHPNFLKTQL
jgi:UDP-N-acetylmuramoyl-L-alanine---L-glutamate ligase